MDEAGATTTEELFPELLLLFKVLLLTTIFGPVVWSVLLALTNVTETSDAKGTPPCCSDAAEIPISSSNAADRLFLALPRAGLCVMQFVWLEILMPYLNKRLVFKAILATGFFVDVTVAIPCFICFFLLNFLLFCQILRIEKLDQMSLFTLTQLSDLI